MRVEFLRKTRLADNIRCAQLNLFTTGHSVDEIRAIKTVGRKIVAFGADNNSWFYITALREAGVGPDIITDNGIKELERFIDDIPIIKPAALLKEKEKYYFIVTLSNIESINQVRKQLLIWGVENFAILTHDFMLDFDRVKHHGLKNAFLHAFNTIYRDIDFTGNRFNEARRRFVVSILWWYEALEWVLDNYGGKKNISLLDVGPGVGLASLIYKQLLGASISWINLNKPNDIDMPSTQKKLIENENIDVQYGYIETDDFYGNYDIIIFTDIIEHLVYDPSITMKKLHGMLNPGGHLIITTPLKKRSGKDEPPYFENWRDRPELTEKRRGYGADILKITAADHVYEYSPKELYEVVVESGFTVVFQDINRTGEIRCICAK